jgi:hypothetical protein
MTFRKLGAALFVAAVLSAVLASSALAAAATEDAKWYTGEAPGTELTGPETVSAEAVGNATFTTEVGSTKYLLEATGIECVGCKIENSGGTAVGSGHLKFKGVTVKEPAGCSVASEIETTSLSLTPDWMIGSTNYWKFAPAAGETTAFATIEITGCALATTIVPKGALAAQAANSTGTATVSVQVSASGAISATAGISLHSGTKTFTVTATWNSKQHGVRLGAKLEVRFF